MTTRYITSEDGDRTDVVLSVAEYEALMEDLQDLAVIAERKDEPTYSLKEVKERLKADGLI
jgi:PHD/YefM family antitoxin component YafN of YafNO toxin-antitoxin module